MFVGIVKFVFSRAELVHKMKRLQIYRFLQWIITGVNILCKSFNVLNNASMLIIQTNKCKTYIVIIFYILYALLHV